MTKNKRNRKAGLASMARDARDAVLKRSMNIAVIAVFLAVVFLLGKAYIYRSDYFRLKKVEIKETLLDQKFIEAMKRRILNAYKDKSVFGLNLKAIANSLQRSYPDARDIFVTLALPDKVMVGLKLRRPVVLVKADRTYPVDEEGVILPPTDISALKWIPLVEGVPVSPEERREKKIVSRNLRAAMALLRAIANVRPVADQGVEAIDTRDLGNMVFYLRNGIEVRIGGENLKRRLDVLAKTLKDPRLIMERIKYIDLRFGDAVIGPK